MANRHRFRPGRYAGGTDNANILASARDTRNRFARGGGVRRGRRHVDDRDGEAAGARPALVMMGEPVSGSRPRPRADRRPRGLATEGMSEPFSRAHEGYAPGGPVRPMAGMGMAPALAAVRRPLGRAEGGDVDRGSPHVVHHVHLHADAHALHTDDIAALADAADRGDINLVHHLHHDEPMPEPEMAPGEYEG